MASARGYYLLLCTSSSGGDNSFLLLLLSAFLHQFLFGISDLASIVSNYLPCFNFLWLKIRSISVLLTDLWLLPRAAIQLEQQPWVSHHSIPWRGGGVLILTSNTHCSPIDSGFLVGHAGSLPSFNTSLLSIPKLWNQRQNRALSFGLLLPLSLSAPHSLRIWSVIEISKLIKIM